MADWSCEFEPFWFETLKALISESLCDAFHQTVVQTVSNVTSGCILKDSVKMVIASYIQFMQLYGLGKEVRSFCSLDFRFLDFL